MANPLGRALRRARNLLVDKAISLNLLPYRKPFAFDTELWNKGYASGEHDHYGSLRELPRYGVLQGYLTALPKDLAILDVGCGVGLIRGKFNDDQVARYCGCDPSDVAVEQARAANWPRSDFHVEVLPPLELGQFDVIICNEMLYLVDDVDELLGRLSTMLKPGGFLLTSITRHPGDSTLFQKLDRYFEKRDAVVLRNETAALKWRLACHTRRSG